MKGWAFKPLITQIDNRYQGRFGREGFQVWAPRLPTLGGQEEKPLLDFQRKYRQLGVPVLSRKEPPTPG